MLEQVKQQMQTKGLFNAAEHLGARWKDYNEYQRKNIARSWGLMLWGLDALRNNG